MIPKTIPGVSPPIQPDWIPDPEWDPPLPPQNLIFDDGEPLETHRHRLAMNVLIESIYQAWPDRSDFFAGGNMFVYYSEDQQMNRDFRGPDVFVVLNVDGKRPRKGWVTWQEQGRYPDVIVELISPTTEKADLGEKKDLYEQTFRTRDYFVFDPYEPQSLAGWQLNGDSLYQPIVPNPQGWLWSRRLELWLGLWHGEILREEADWLRLYRQDGSLVLLPFEEAQQERQRAEQERQRADQEHQRAERLAERLRALGLDPEQ
ncbi:MAG: Uma2 family endonuclease [Cyanobacteriota bacterium]|nr:Uma2 family endonuclease [Cyanobacteriota bacterium]